MKTLVIHPVDHTTNFLSQIYKDKDWTVITGNLPQYKLLTLLSTHDRIIMLGHGTPHGLIGHGRFIINPTHVWLLRQKECIAIWCHADKFVKKYNLKGFYTGMFISELEEAYDNSIYNTDYPNIHVSNNLFATIVSEEIDNPNLLEAVKTKYNTMGCSVVAFNRDLLGYNKLEEDEST